jgi:hypothetical protein
VITILQPLEAAVNYHLVPVIHLHLLLKHSVILLHHHPHGVRGHLV